MKNPVPVCKQLLFVAMQAELECVALQIWLRQTL